MSTTNNPAPRKRRRPLRWIILAAVVLIVFIGCAVALNPGGDSEPSTAEETTMEGTTAAPKPRADEVTLTVTSTGPATVSFGPAGSFSTESFDGQWSKVVPYEWGDGYTLSVSPDFTGAPAEGPMELSCEITKEGKVQDEQRASGEYATVMCSVM